MITAAPAGGPGSAFAAALGRSGIGQQLVAAGLVHGQFVQRHADVLELLRQLRLEALHRELLDPCHHHLGIRALYKRWQLSDSPSTGQAFKVRYGTTPAALRRQLSP